jgi:hypothetical protein
MPHSSPLFAFLALPLLFGCGAELEEAALNEPVTEQEEAEKETATDHFDETLALGLVDDNATLACSQFAGTPIILPTATSLAEAAQAIIQISEGQAYGLQLPSEGSGFIALEIGSWMESVRFFTEHGTAYEILGGTEGFEITNNGSCPSEGITDQRWFFHEWGSYTIRIDNSAENPAWFMAVVE